MSKNGDASTHQRRLEYRQRGKQNLKVVVRDQEIGLTEQDERGTLCLLSRENCAEIGVSRDYNSVLLERPGEDFLVRGRLHFIGSHMNCIVPRCDETVSEARR